MKIKKVCVYCASSRQANPVYRDAARQLGEILAMNSITIVYGGGAVGSMGALADGAISKGGRVVGIIPRFMVEMEWANGNISDLIVSILRHVLQLAILPSCFRCWIMFCSGLGG